MPHDANLRGEALSLPPYQHTRWRRRVHNNMYMEHGGGGGEEENTLYLACRCIWENNGRSLTFNNIYVVYGGPGGGVSALMWNYIWEEV